MRDANMRNLNTHFKKRFAVLIVAMITLFGMSFTSFAEPATLTGGKTTGGAGTAITDGVAISKEIIFINDETTNVREPNIIYEYTVSKASPATDTTITQGTEVVNVKAGVLDANTNADHKATVTFSDSERSEATASGTADTKTFTLTFDPSVYTEAGIYRYKVTESLASSKTKDDVGIVAADTYTTTRYLDVYVEEATGGRQIYGYVLYDGAETDSLTRDSVKSNGWVNTSTGTTPANVDVYTTHNVVVKKTITGAMANKNHRFPFAIEISQTGVDGSTKIDVSTTGAFPTTGGPTELSNEYYITGDGTPTKATLNVLLSNDTEAVISGIPGTATVVVTETNDTTLKYKVSATKKVGTADAEEALSQTAVDAGGTAKVNLSSVNITAKTEIAYTNNMNAPSPTGIILHFWPFILISLLAIVLLVMSFRKKRA